MKLKTQLRFLISEIPNFRFLLLKDMQVSLSLDN